MLLPLRLIVFSVGIITVVFGSAVIGLFPNGRFKRWLNEKLMLVRNLFFVILYFTINTQVCMRIGSRAFSALIYFHDCENKATSGGKSEIINRKWIK
jgi:hypothetical protein